MSERVYEESGILRQYLNEIGRIPLLIKEQEIAHAKDIAAGVTILRSATGDHDPKHLISHFYEPYMYGELAVTLEELDVVEAAFAARESMMEANLRWVVRIAKGYQSGTELTLLDLIQEGTVGLSRAVDKFDHTKGYKFSTYSRDWIKQAIGRAVDKASGGVTVPYGLPPKVRTLIRTTTEVEQRARMEGREVTQAELADAMGVSVLELENIQLAQLRLGKMSLNATIDEGETTELGDMLADTLLPDPQAEVVVREDTRQLRQVLMELSEREREHMVVLWGLEDGIKKSFAEAGRVIGCSRESVRRTERIVFEKIRQRIPNPYADEDFPAA